MDDTAAHPVTDSPWNDMLPRQRLLTQLLACFFENPGGVKLDPAAAQRVIDLPEFRAWLINQWNNGFVTVSPEEARDLLTGDLRRSRNLLRPPFFDVEEVAELLDFRYNVQQVRALARVPFTPVLLERVRFGWVLMPGLPVSIQDLRSKFPALFSGDEWPDGTWSEEPVPVEWLLLRDTPIRDSGSKSLPQQRKLLRRHESLPYAQVVVYSLVISRLATSRWPVWGSLRCQVDGWTQGHCLVVSCDAKNDRLSFSRQLPEFDAPDLQIISRVVQEPHQMFVGDMR